LAGLENGPRLDAVCLNTAPIFLLAGEVENLKPGVQLARDLIVSGKAVAKLREWVACQNQDPNAGVAKLEEVMRRASIA
jgi:anthranilate phosphoribosyltransferase